ncbi:hypothetical protein ABZ863_01735 [Saccharomonospora sp. NPDC046836]|uniref:hypothetical protein n=1 Tax=Saccharomonospora sp. NPDC046836 TaxID=3156921 RepID=UPI0033DFAAC1
MPEVYACVLGCRNPDGMPNEAAPGLLACHGCARQLATDLAAVEQLYDAHTDLETHLPRSDGQRGAPGYGPRSPALDALAAHFDPRTKWTPEHGFGALAVVSSWARAIREDTTLNVPRERVRQTVPAGPVTMARELATIRFHWHYLLAQDWLPDFGTELRDVLRQLRAVGRELTPSVRIGPCPVVVDEIEVDDEHYPTPITCNTPLHVHAGATEIRCRGCGTNWPRARWHKLGDPWADYAALAEQLDVPVGTLRRWCHQDGWATSGTRGRRLVARADALASYARRRLAGRPDGHDRIYRLDTDRAAG